MQTSHATIPHKPPELELYSFNKSAVTLQLQHYVWFLLTKFTAYCLRHFVCCDVSYSIFCWFSKENKTIVEILLFIFIFTQMKQINTNYTCIETTINVWLKPLITQLMQLKKIIAQTTALTDTGIYVTLMKQDLSVEVRSDAICL